MWPDSAYREIKTATRKGGFSDSPTAVRGRRMGVWTAFFELGRNEEIPASLIEEGQDAPCDILALVWFRISLCSGSWDFPANSPFLWCLLCNLPAAHLSINPLLELREQETRIHFFSLKSKRRALIMNYSTFSFASSRDLATIGFTPHQSIDPCAHRLPNSTWCTPLAPSSEMGRFARIACIWNSYLTLTLSAQYNPFAWA